MTTPRSLFIVAMLAIGFLSTSQAHAATDAERFASLIRRAQKSPSPALAMLTEFWPEKDIDLSPAEIREAMRLAQIDPQSKLGIGLTQVDRITKRGKTVTFKRPTATTLDLGKGTLKLQPTCSFNISAGYIKNLGWSNRRRLKQADTNYGYVHVDDIKGVKVGESSSLMVNLYEFFYVKENGKPIVHGRGGIPIYTQWERVEIPEGMPKVDAARIGITGRLARED